MTRYVALDLETTSADPFKAHPLEIAAIEYAPHWEDEHCDQFAIEGQLVAFVPHHDKQTIAAADYGALAVNRYFERRLFDNMATADRTAALDGELYDLLDGATLVGANPAYDATVLRFYFARCGYANTAPWHYRMFDVEAATAAVKGLDHVPSLPECLAHWDIERMPAEQAHTAYGDASVTLEVFHAIRSRTFEARPLVRTVELPPLPEADGPSEPVFVPRTDATGTA